MENVKALQIFNFQDQEVRTTVVDGVTWWVASDVCKILGLGNVSMAVNGNEETGNVGLDEDEKGIMITDTPGGKQQVLFVNESGLYHLIFKSRKEEARTFRKWVTSEVLPSIRKTGSYSLADRLDFVALQKEMDALEGMQRDVLTEPAPFYMVAHLRNEVAEQQKDIRELQEYINNREVQQETLRVVGPERDVLLATQDSPLLRAIHELIDLTNGSWEGMLMELRPEMVRHNLDLDGVPTGLSHLSRHLKRIKNLARYQGIEVRLLTQRKGGRPVHIRQLESR